MNSKYWTERQDALLQKHNNARPNQKAFRFSNVAAELKKCQEHINSCKRKECYMDREQERDVYVWHGFHHGLLHRMDESVAGRRKEVIRIKPSREVYTRLRLLRLVKGELPKRLVDDRTIYGLLTDKEIECIMKLHKKECGCKMGTDGDIMNCEITFPGWKRGSWQLCYLVPLLQRWYKLCTWWRASKEDYAKLT